MLMGYTAAAARFRVPDARIGTLLALLGGLIFAAVVTWLVVKWRERQRKGQALNMRMKQLRLSEGEQDVARQLSRHVPAARAEAAPTAVLDETGVFEEAVEGFLNSVMREGGEVELGNYDGAIAGTPPEAQAVASLRMKLGHDGPQRGIYYSTRELQPGQEIYIAIGTGPKAVTVRARVGRRREDFLGLTDIQPRNALIVGHAAEIGFFSRGHNFNFATQVVHIDRANGSGHALHSQAVRTGGRRRYYRVPVRGPVKVGAPDAATDCMFDGTLCDLSAGGAGVVCPVRLDGIDKLSLDISPDRCMGEMTRTAPGRSTSRGTVNRYGMSDMRVAAWVVGVQQHDEGFFYHLEFRSIRPAEEQHLSRFVNMIESAAIR